MRRFVIGGTVCLICLSATSAAAQRAPAPYVGVLGGVSTLSADAHSKITTSGEDVSLYTPENGAALDIVFGVHIHRYVSLQANYVWNANAVALTSVRGSMHRFTNSVEPAVSTPSSATSSCIFGTSAAATVGERCIALNRRRSFGSHAPWTGAIAPGEDALGRVAWATSTKLIDLQHLRRQQLASPSSSASISSALSAWRR